MNFLSAYIRFVAIFTSLKKGPKKQKRGVFLGGQKRPFFRDFLGFEGYPGSGEAPKYKQEITPTRKLTCPCALINKDPKK